METITNHPSCPTTRISVGVLRRALIFTTSKQLEHEDTAANLKVGKSREILLRDPILDLLGNGDSDSFHFLGREINTDFLSTRSLKRRGGGQGGQGLRLPKRSSLWDGLRRKIHLE